MLWLEITKKLAEQGLNILAIEPNIAELPFGLPNNITLISIEENQQADIHLMLVDHNKFKVNFSIESNYIVDTKGILM